MVDSNTSCNLRNLSDNAISALKKADLVQHIINRRGKVIVDSDRRNLRDQISNLYDAITKYATANQQIDSELAVVKLVNRKLEKRVIDLEKNQAKSEHHSRKNNVKFSNIPKIYQIISWEAKGNRSAVNRMLQLITMTLRVVIASLFQDIVEVIIKG